MTIEWTEEIGISSISMLNFLDKIVEFFNKKNYGTGVDKIRVILIYRPVHLKQRKRFRKADKIFDYDIILDYYEFKHLLKAAKRDAIRDFMIECTHQTFSKYRIKDFDKDAFLKDFTESVKSIEWTT